MKGDVICAKKTCPAYATQDVCPVHSPDKVVERAKAIVEGNFDRVTGLGPLEIDIFNKLRADVLRDLESTI